MSALLLSLSGCGSAPPAPAPGYTVTATPLIPASARAGSTSSSTITVTSSNGYAGRISLSCSKITGGTQVPTCSFSPSTVGINPTAPGTSTLTVSCSSGTTGGNYVFTVTGSDADRVAPSNGSQALALTITAGIQHVVVIFQENRTTDNLFQDSVLISRGADIASSGVNSLARRFLSPPSIWVRPDPALRITTSSTAIRTSSLCMTAAKWMGQTGFLRPDRLPSQRAIQVRRSLRRSALLRHGRAIHFRRPHVSDQPRSKFSRSPVHYFRHFGAPTATSPLFAAENPDG